LTTMAFTSVIVGDGEEASVHVGHGFEPVRVLESAHN
jgi:hypothetical protein